MERCIFEFLKPELFILVPVLYFIGVGLKRSVVVSDRYIPLLLGGAGILLAALYVASAVESYSVREVILAIFMGITQGILCAGCTVYIHQLIKQAGKDK